VTTIIGISGSLRRQSFNSALLRAAVDLMPPGVTLEIVSIEAIPLYNADIEASAGVPAAVAQLKDRIAACAGVLVATPEYNNSMPGVVKNAIDWLSRPPPDIPRVFHGRKIAIMGASPGPYGTTQAQTAWLPVLRTLRMQPWHEGRLLVPRAGEVFDAQGAIVDEQVRTRLRDFVQGFARFVSS
jgi:chromate reductase, NAD(P)H dehydrogenase (quinone)